MDTHVHSPSRHLALLATLGCGVALAQSDPAAVPNADRTPIRMSGPAPKVTAPDGTEFRVANAFADPDTVLFDRTDAGDVWCSAASYKVGFHPGHVEFVPFLGSEAPRNYPVDFRLVSIAVGGEALAMSQGPEPAIGYRAVSYDRGGFEERYELGAAGMEQSFVFPTLPRRGELAIRIAVDSQLPMSGTDATIAFTNELGGVDYGRAWAIDAAGRRIEVQRRWHGAAIEIVVPEPFVTEARLPLVVDPLVGSATTVTTQTTGIRLGSADLTYDASVDRYMVCYELVFSATDSDVFCYELGNGGSVATGQFVVDNTGAESWMAPRIASNNLANRYLVVAQVSFGNVAPRSIRGRTQNSGSTIQGNKFVIAEASAADPGEKVRPDVCGDPSLVAPTYFTVVYETALSGTDHDIHARQLTSDLNPLSAGSLLSIDSSTAYEEAPQISRSMGAPSPDATYQQAMIVYKRRTASGSEIRGRQVSWNGLLGTNFLISSGSANQAFPSVSSTTLPADGGNHLYLVAWEDGNVGGRDIRVALCKQPGQVVVGAQSLAALETDLQHPAFAGWDQYYARVATDGCRFAVAYRENYNNSGDIDGRISTVHARTITPGALALGVSESRAWPASSAFVETSLAVASRYDGAADSGAAQAFTRYGLTWINENGTGSDLLTAQVYDGMAPNGGFALRSTGCGGLGITWSGTPALGERFRITASGSTTMGFGTPLTQPMPINGCPSSCKIGLQNIATLPTTSIELQVPCDPNLIGSTVGFQAFTLNGGPCFGALGLSDTVAVTIR